jgi:hypothetical protein
VGRETTSVVFDGPTWWSLSPHLGAKTNAGARNQSHGKGPGGELLDAVGARDALSLTVVGSDRPLGRDCLIVRVLPLEPTDSDTLFETPFSVGADECLWTVDSQTGTVLRVEARRHGLPFEIIEMTEVEFDQELSDGIFRIELPKGKEFDSLPPIRRVEVADLPNNVPFVVYAIPNPRPRMFPGPVRIHSRPDESGMTNLSVTITYALLEIGNLWLSESSAPLWTPPDLEWHSVDELEVSEEIGPDYRTCRVRLTKEGTHLLLDTSVMTLGEVMALARSLQPLRPS